ncbi:hypothetical protein M405DRAFT_144727 [Rhizopogon salebrosus TDB-379]|nr:hypothetical protein M405DRAFT_144727 [Rhizopogon salebrosus TDB-379]
MVHRCITDYNGLSGHEVGNGQQLRLTHQEVDESRQLDLAFDEGLVQMIYTGYLLVSATAMSFRFYGHRCRRKRHKAKNLFSTAVFRQLVKSSSNVINTQQPNLSQDNEGHKGLQKLT